MLSNKCNKVMLTYTKCIVCLLIAQLNQNIIIAGDQNYLNKQHNMYMHIFHSTSTPSTHSETM